jgi:hypothetical protein
MSEPKVTPEILREAAHIDGAWRVRTTLLAAADRIEELTKELAAADKAADDRWCKALEVADWDGEVFHYDGRIYPWPRGFVPDVPATWEEKIAPLRQELAAERAKVAAAGEILHEFVRHERGECPGRDVEYCVSALRERIHAWTAAIPHPSGSGSVSGRGRTPNRRRPRHPKTARP